VRRTRKLFNAKKPSNIAKCATCSITDTGDCLHILNVHQISYHDTGCDTGDTVTLDNYSFNVLLNSHFLFVMANGTVPQSSVSLNAFQSLRLRQDSIYVLLPVIGCSQGCGLGLDVSVSDLCVSDLVSRSRPERSRACPPMAVGIVLSSSTGFL